jgi:WD40 repeat protein
MKLSLPRFCLSLLVCALASAPALLAQTPPRCQPPALATAAKEPNIFTAQQESDLGDAIAEHVQRNFRLIEDEAVTGRLRSLGAALVKQIPPTDLRFQFFLVDLPEANAFAMPGGRIYVSRKLVAFARNEDELASVLAHEIGHLAARQTAIDMTRAFRKVLGVTSVGDRRDIFEKYNQLVENVARKPGAFGHGEEESEQLEADQIGLYAMAAAGYDPQTFAAFWDRFAETKGKTGGFFSDLFGRTNPNARRLREIVKGLQALPAECRAARPAGAAEEFATWQAEAVSFSGAGRKEALHDVLSKKTLDPALRGDINHLRFSPDGKYLLAQDDSGINVLTREPLAPLFRIEAPEAQQAQFTPDAREVVFHHATLRVEAWDIAARKASAVREMHVREGCMQTELAPDGQTLACLDTNYALTLYDVGTGAQIFQKKDFFKPDFSDLINMILVNILRSGDADLADLAPDIDWVSMKFAPDGRRFAAGQRSTNFTAFAVSTDVSAVIYDLDAKATVPAKGQLKKMLSGNFAFLAPDRVVAVNPEDGRKSAVMSFPAGDVLEPIEIGGAPESVARGNYILLRPIRGYALGVYDLATKKIFLANKTRAFDIYGDVFAAERINGEIGLYAVQGQELKAQVVLPRNTLGRLRAASVSPDFKWLAVSERSRGAVWDLMKGERAFHVRGFRGAHFGDDATLYADFPTHGDMKRTVARLNLTTRDVAGGASIEDTWRAEQHGPYILARKPLKKGGDLSQNVSVEASDARTGAPLWSKEFPKESPRVWVDPAGDLVALAWAVKSGAAKAEIKADPKLAQRLAAMKEKEGDYLLQTLDARTGRQTSALLIETGKGSFRVAGVASAGDLLIVSDTENRVLVYSLADGEQKGRFFGGRPAVSKAANLLSVENERGQLIVYDLATMAKRDEFTFNSPVALTRFSPDGKRLFVLTANQTAYVLGLDATKQAR